MPLTLYQQLTAIEAEALQRADPLFSNLAKVCKGLLDLIEQNRGDLTNAFEAQVRTDQRLHEVEKRMPGYQERG